MEIGCQTQWSVKLGQTVYLCSASYFSSISFQNWCCYMRLYVQLLHSLMETLSYWKVLVIRNTLGYVKSLVQRLWLSSKSLCLFLIYEVFTAQISWGLSCDSCSYLNCTFWGFSSRRLVNLGVIQYATQSLGLLVQLCKWTFSKQKQWEAVSIWNASDLTKLCLKVTALMRLYLVALLCEN